MSNNYTEKKLKLSQKIISSVAFFIFIFVLSYKIFKTYSSVYIPLIIILAGALIYVVIWSDKLTPYKFLLPSIIILTILSGFPIVYTTFISFTNLRDGNILSKDSAKKSLLNSKWLILPNKKPLYAEYFVTKDIIDNYLEESDIKLSAFDEKMDNLIENGVSDEAEEKLWRERDNLDFDIIKKHLGKLKKDAFVIVLYSEKDFTENEIEEKDIDSYIYIGNEGVGMNLDKINIDEIGKLTENRYLIGKKIFLRENVDSIDNLDVQLFDSFYKTLSGNTDRVVRNNQTLNIGTDRYHLETSNEFLCKIPWYIINDSGDSPLLKLSVDNNGEYRYDTKIFNDDNRGYFCSTIDGKKVKYWKEYRVKLQDYKYGALGFLRNRGFENFLSVRLRELNFNDAIRNDLPEEVLSLFYGKEYKSINKEDWFRIRKAFKAANDQVKNFNKLIVQKKFKDRFEAEYGENVLIIPKIPEFRLILFEKSNVLDKDYISPGYTINIGFRNFKSLFVVPKFSENFIRILRWTFIFAFLSTLASFLIGFLLSIIMNTAGFKGKNIYRTILILPYAIPSAISTMVWAAMLNQDFGMINRFLNLNIPWLYDPILTKITVILVNVWLSFPFFMVVCSGALQSVDRELYDIASVDGANRFQKIIYITLPLILITIGPFMVGYVGLSFNNFTIIYLLTYQGSDIFVSWIYNLAFRSKEYGLAGAVALLSFIIIGPLMLAQLKLTGFFKDKRLN